MTRRLTLIALAAAALGTLLLAACSSEEEAPAPASTSTVVAAPPTESGTVQPRREPTKRPTATKSAPTKPLSTATGIASTPTPPAGDGTIDALGPGSTNPVPVKSNPSTFSGTALLADLRTSKQAPGDRVVFEFQGSALPPGKVEYVQTASACGSGLPVTVQGTAILSINLSQAAAHDEQGKSTFAPTMIPGPGQTAMEIVRTCDSGGVLSWAIGVAGKKNFKVTTLQNPTRLVVDILK